MKILIVSGFLGAGKTTFIKEMAKKTGKDFAILENEYGAEGIDGDRLQSASMGQVNIWEMTEECICCSAKGDFAESVLTIANSVDPEFLIVEPTGVAMPDRIVQNLQQIEYERITLLAPVTIVDGQNFHAHIHEYPLLFQSQIECASTLLVSKSEHLSSDEKTQLERRLRELNSKADIVTDHYSKMSTEKWQQLLTTAYNGEVLPSETPKYQVESMDSFSLKDASMDSPEMLFLMLESLIRGTFGNIPRAKGTIRIGTHGYRFDVSGGLYSVIGEDQMQTGKAVFIGRDINRSLLRKFFMTTASRSGSQTKKIKFSKKSVISAHNTSRRS